MVYYNSFLICILKTPCTVHVHVSARTYCTSEDTDLVDIQKQVSHFSDILHYRIDCKWIKLVKFAS